MPFERCYPASKVEVEKPKTYDTMVELAENLATNIPFVRVDFYEISGEIYFGELTFFRVAILKNFRRVSRIVVLENGLNYQKREKLFIIKIMSY